MTDAIKRDLAFRTIGRTRNTVMDMGADQIKQQIGLLVYHMDPTVASVSSVVQIVYELFPGCGTDFEKSGKHVLDIKRRAYKDATGIGEQGITSSGIGTLGVCVNVYHAGDNLHYLRNGGCACLLVFFVSLTS